jgi:hypothetical protein
MSLSPLCLLFASSLPPLCFLFATSLLPLCYLGNSAGNIIRADRQIRYFYRYEKISLAVMITGIDVD